MHRVTGFVMYIYVHAQHLHGLLADRSLQKDPTCIWNHTKCVISRPGVGWYISVTLCISVDRWSLITKEHWCWKCFHFMTSACVSSISPSIPQTTRIWFWFSRGSCTSNPFLKSLLFCLDTRQLWWPRMRFSLQMIPCYSLAALQRLTG